MAGIGIEVLFIAGFGLIDRDVAESRALYGDSLGILFKEDAGGYLYTGTLQGAKHFALWPLSPAAQSCFGSNSWPDNIPVPQAWLEFEVDNVEKATADLESRGHRMLIKNKTEPWGQTVSRFLSPEGLLVGITLTPSLRGKKYSGWTTSTLRLLNPDGDAMPKLGGLIGVGDWSSFSKDVPMEPCTTTAMQAPSVSFFNWKRLE